MNLSCIILKIERYCSRALFGVPRKSRGLVWGSRLTNDSQWGQDWWPKETELMEEKNFIRGGNTWRNCYHFYVVSRYKWPLKDSNIGLKTVSLLSLIVSNVCLQTVKKGFWSVQLKIPYRDKPIAYMVFLLCTILSGLLHLRFPSTRSLPNVFSFKNTTCLW